MFSRKLAEKSWFGARVARATFVFYGITAAFLRFLRHRARLSSKSKKTDFSDGFGHSWDLGVQLGYRMYAFLRVVSPSGL